MFILDLEDCGVVKVSDNEFIVVTKEAAFETLEEAKEFLRGWYLPEYIPDILRA